MALADDGAVQAAFDLYDTTSKRAATYERDKARQDSAMAQWRLRVEHAQQTIKTGQTALDRLEMQVNRDVERLARAKEQLAAIGGDREQVVEIDVNGSGQLMLEDGRQLIRMPESLLPFLRREQARQSARIDRR